MSWVSEAVFSVVASCHDGAVLSELRIANRESRIANRELRPAQGGWFGRFFGGNTVRLS